MCACARVCVCVCNHAPLLTAPDDYVAQSSEFTFRAGQTVQCVDITVNVDELTEGAEVFIGRITDEQGNPRVTLDPNVATVTIVDGNCEYTAFQ